MIVPFVISFDHPIRRSLIWLTMLCLTPFLLTGCAAADPPHQELLVFAASSLTDAFTEIAAAYQAQNPDVVVVFNFAGSSQLAAQLVEGATADVFASANNQQMETAVAAGRIAATAPVAFAVNKLTVLVPADNPAGVETWTDLHQPGLKLILAVPGVPVRQYTDEIMTALGAEFAQQVYANLVSEEENVRQVVAKVALGEADAGVVYTSDVTPDIAARVRQIDIPNTQNVTAVYPIAPLLDAPQAAQAQQFIQFVRSAAGQAILARWGFEALP